MGYKIHKSIVQSRKITKRMYALPKVVIPGRGIWVNLIFPLLFISIFFFLYSEHTFLKEFFFKSFKIKILAD